MARSPAYRGPWTPTACAALALRDSSRIKSARPAYLCGSIGHIDDAGAGRHVAIRSSDAGSRCARDDGGGRRQRVNVSLGSHISNGGYATRRKKREDNLAEPPPPICIRLLHP